MRRKADVEAAARLKPRDPTWTAQQIFDLDQPPQCATRDALPQSSAIHHVIGQEFGTRLRRVHDPLADQITQRLGGAAAERAVTRAAIETRYRKFIREAESAVQLDRL